MDKPFKQVNFDPGPMSPTHLLSPDEHRQRLAALANVGVRLMPFPFASAVSVVSDIDGSGRRRFDSYVGILVGDLGLDFGDSIFLQTPSGRSGDGKYRGRGLGLLSKDLRTKTEDDPDFYGQSLTFSESMRQFHLGNIDHFHAFFSQGPRMVPLPVPKAGSNGTCLCLPIENISMSGMFSCREFFVHGVCTVTRRSQAPDIKSIALELHDNRTIDVPLGEPSSRCDDRRVRTVFTLDRGADGDISVPNILDLKEIRISFESGLAADAIEGILLLSAPGITLIERVNWLREVYNVEIPLVTEHAALHFRNPAAARAHDLARQEQYRAIRSSDPSILLALYGRLVDEDSDMALSIDADDPGSFSRVLPDLTVHGEIRFVVPEASANISGFSPLQLVSPSPTRAGGAIYWARRMCPNIQAPPPGRKRDNTRSQHDTFVRRLEVIVRAAADEPGMCWPLYTHIGGGAVLEAEGEPSPYFELDPLRQVQDRIFNQSGRVPHNERIWFCRASTIYDYALMLRSIAGHIERPDANTARITSWFDHIVQKTMPRGPEQLYGLTIYVDDPRLAQVWLDGTPISKLIRNRADETGRPSVTIAECGIRHVIFDRLDPTRNQPEAASSASGSWSWRVEEGSGRSYAHLQVQSAQDGEARISFVLRGLEPLGAQHLAFALRRDPGVLFAVEVETIDGACFRFCDPGFTDQERPATAFYVFGQHDRSPGQWQELVAPFHDMTWLAAQSGGPLPSHALKAVTIRCRGEAGRGIDIAGLAFLRPRTIARQNGSTRGFVVCGRTPTGAAGQTVHLAPETADVSAQVRTATIDQYGHFNFAGVPAGVYRVWSNYNGQTMHDRRGGHVEVMDNVADLELCVAAA